MPGRLAFVDDLCGTGRRTIQRGLDSSVLDRNRSRSGSASLYLVPALASLRAQSRHEPAVCELLGLSGWHQPDVANVCATAGPTDVAGDGDAGADLFLQPGNDGVRRAVGALRFSRLPKPRVAGLAGGGRRPVVR